jgi:hypothetical protein
MRMIRIALLFWLPFAASAQEWPHNPQTGKVEFRPALPWPAAVTTERQRQALVQHWYEAKLSLPFPSEVRAALATRKRLGLLTYADVAKRAVWSVEDGDLVQQLVYAVSLTPNPKGVAVVLSDFKTSQGTADETPLEAHLRSPAPNEPAALTALRKRLAAALAGWN